MTVKSCEECGKCCMETEMIISTHDIKRIISNYENSLKQDDFCHLNEEGFFQLKNKKGICYFFDLNAYKCKIYNFRPKGCRFYPLVYDLDNECCIFDSDCPNPSLFYDNIEKIKITCEEIINFLKSELNLL